MSGPTMLTTPSASGVNEPNFLTSNASLDNIRSLPFMTRNSACDMDMGADQFDFRPDWNGFPDLERPDMAEHDLPDEYFAEIEWTGLLGRLHTPSRFCHPSPDAARVLVPEKRNDVGLHSNARAS